MKERPILFNAPMVSAILAGTKAQTRRVAKLTEAAHVKETRGHRRWHPADPNAVVACPYGQPGERLWVREAWGWYIGTPSKHEFDNGVPVFYRADYSAEDERTKIMPKKWRPSIHMPRWASRILLEIISVRVERLQDISEADAKAEGARFGYGEPFVPENTITDRRRFELLWESLNGPGSWDTDPWVWVIEFKRVTP